MYITIVTLFPEMFHGPLTESILKRAQQQKIVTIAYVNIRDFAHDKHKSVDDHPYGGGAGMILRVDIVDQALAHAKSLHPNVHTRTILLDPQGTTYSQHIAQQLAAFEYLILLCGHYEGVDERIRALVDEEISIGDYILTCGEIPAMVLVDSIVRLLPGTLKKEGATTSESFSGATPLLEYPQYTTPQTYKGKSVPAILLSGHHANIEKWKQKEAQKRTKLRRSDLITET
jgi:tRNA (guanine37-N1)-methyltransferase